MECIDISINSKALEQISKLDFKMLIFKLMDNEEGEGWTYKKCIGVEQRYKNFLKLIFLYPHERIVPDKEVDKFWHYHILDTKDYIKVTNRIFGSYLHHNPYFGLQGGSNKDELKVSFQRTNELYRKHFNTVDLIDCSHCSNDGDPDDSSTCVSRCSN